MSTITDNINTYFSFGVSQPFRDFHVKISHPDITDPRPVMMRWFGTGWSFEYSEAEWERWERASKRYPTRCLLHVEICEHDTYVYSALPGVLL